MTGQGTFRELTTSLNNKTFPPENGAPYAVFAGILREDGKREWVYQPMTLWHRHGETLKDFLSRIFEEGMSVRVYSDAGIISIGYVPAEWDEDSDDTEWKPLTNLVRRDIEGFMEGDFKYHEAFGNCVMFP